MSHVGLDPVDVFAALSDVPGAIWLDAGEQRHGWSILTWDPTEVVRDAAEAGAGLARLQSYQVAQAVADGRLRIVMAEWEPPASPVHLVHAEARAATAKVSAFLGHATPRLRQVLQDLDGQLA